MNGIVEGGWAFVYAAYVVTILLLGGYAVRTFVLSRSASRYGGE